MLIELYSPGVTVVLRAKTDRKSAISPQRSHFDLKFQVEGGVPTNNFSMASGCPTTLPMTVFTQRNFVADFLQTKCDFKRKSAVLRFCAPFAGLGATYDDHLRLIGKRVEDFLFSVGVTA